MSRPRPRRRWVRCCGETRRTGARAITRPDVPADRTARSGLPHLARRCLRKAVQPHPGSRPSATGSSRWRAWRGWNTACPPQRGPSAADMAAAAEMSSEDRAAMVRGMVERLADRLAREGGPAEDWARLITALGVLGETDDARDIYAEARETFGSEPSATSPLSMRRPNAPGSPDDPRDGRGLRRGAFARRGRWRGSTSANAPSAWPCRTHAVGRVAADNDPPQEVHADAERSCSRSSTSAGSAARSWACRATWTAPRVRAASRPAPSPATSRA